MWKSIEEREREGGQSREGGDEREERRGEKRREKR